MVSRKDLLERRCHEIVDRADRAERSLETELVVLRAECAALQAALASRDRALTEMSIHNRMREQERSRGSNSGFDDYASPSARREMSQPRFSGEAFDSPIISRREDHPSPSRQDDFRPQSPQSARQFEEMNFRLQAQEKALMESNRKIEENNAVRPCCVAVISLIGVCVCVCAGTRETFEKTR